MSLSLLEVMDKEPGIASFWVIAVVLGGAGFFLARRRWWWSLPIAGLLTVGFLGTWAEWTDPSVGSAIAAEAGRSYPWHLIGSTVLALVMPIAGALRKRRNA